MELLTVKQIAIILKLHPLTIRRYIREGKLEAVKVAGSVRIKKESFNKLIQSFMPQIRPKVGLKSNLKTNQFLSSDPFFRLKGRAMSYHKLQNK